uniref:Uncharacterized protein n=1 Tax=Glossina austeni TaxID=7395 RepID=A0A1A9VV37_GLOAU
MPEPRFDDFERSGLRKVDWNVNVLYGDELSKEFCHRRNNCPRKKVDEREREFSCAKDYLPFEMTFSKVINHKYAYCSNQKNEPLFVSSYGLKSKCLQTYTCELIHILCIHLKKNILQAIAAIASHFLDYHNTSGGYINYR